MHSPIIILGVGRSGTSVAAGMLCRMGVYLGRHLQAPDEWNPHGYYEDTHISKLHEQCLQGEISSITMYAKLDRILKRREGLEQLWGWKDPRTLYFLPYYRERYPDARWIVCTRDPEHVCASFRRVYSLNRNDAAILYSARMNRIMNGLRGRRGLIIDFSTILTQPENSTRLLAHFIGLKPTPKVLAAAAASIERRSPGLSPGIDPDGAPRLGLHHQNINP